MKAVQLLADSPLPLMLEPKGGPGPAAAGFVDWATANRAEIDAWTHDAGVLLLRGFAIDSAETFREAARAIRPDLRNYVGGDSPRRSVKDKVYTSTEYPADQEVLLHNELSYAGWSPERVFFYCRVPAESGGETTIADGRAIYRAVPEAIRGRFEEMGITYLQHLWDAAGESGPGKSWQETFESDDRGKVEAYLKRSGMSCDWTDLGLRTAARHPAVLAHPVTGELCWHNQADQWHRDLASVKDLVPGSPEAPLGDPEAGTEGLGNHVRFGDGTEIDVEDLMAIRAASRACEVTFPWHAGDIMVIDNVMAMHGRKPFTGPRRVLVAMA